MNANYVSRIILYDFAVNIGNYLQLGFWVFPDVQDYKNQTDVKQCWLGDNIVALPDINTEDPSIVSTLNAWVKDLINKYQVDGLQYLVLDIPVGGVRYHIGSPSMFVTPV